jgi:dCTP deaminase
VRADGGVGRRQIQPASLDLRLGAEGRRIASGFLPGRRPIDAHARDLLLYRFRLDRGAYLEQGQVYLFRLVESLRLPPGVRSAANPKSSIGRLDVSTKLLVEGHPRFDEVPPGYAGPLFLLVFPRTFSIRVHSGLALHQIRFFRDPAPLDDGGIRATQAEDAIVLDERGRRLRPRDLRVDRGLYLRVGLRPAHVAAPVGYRARRFRGAIDLARIGHYRLRDFFEPLQLGRRDGGLQLEPEAFYLFASKERIRIPPMLAAEMVPYEVGVGEMRSNYAGFFDCGFGGTRGLPAVLEVRPHDVPFLVEDGQSFFKLRFERMARRPSFLYGSNEAGSSYAGQALSPSKHFRLD